jgi:hypothetical protein
MVKKHYRIFWLCCLMIVPIAGCDSTKNNIDANNFQLTLAAAPTTLLIGEFSAVTATLNNVDASAPTGTSTATPTPTPVIGYPVMFTITQNTSKCTLTVVNGITDTSGKAVAIYQAGSIAGIDTLQASIDRGQTASASIIVSMSPTPTPTPTP